MEIIKGLDLTKLSKAELIAIICKLVDKIELLEARIVELETRLAGRGKAVGQ